MNRLFVIALSAIGMMSLAAAFLAPGMGGVAASPDAPAAESKGKSDGDKAMVLHRNGSGQFTLQVAVNGSEVEFLVDTGADLVALTVEEAEALGVMPDESEFEPSMQTASGVGYGAHIVLEEIEIGGHRLQDVDAVVVKDLGTNLLGQSVLRRLGSVELKGDRMVIKPK